MWFSTFKAEMGTDWISPPTASRAIPCCSSIFWVYDCNVTINNYHNTKDKVNILKQLQSSSLCITVEPVLKGYGPIGHKIAASRARWSLVTGSITLKCRTLWSVKTVDTSWHWSLETRFPAQSINIHVIYMCWYIKKFASNSCLYIERSHDSVFILKLNAIEVYVI